MATQAQINANRKNAQKSTGPKTPEGRDAVRLNGLKHGLASEILVLCVGPAILPASPHSCGVLLAASAKAGEPARLPARSPNPIWRQMVNS